nr:MAG TPA: hypothetical protein [Bacteriophage sp.]
MRTSIIKYRRFFVIDYSTLYSRTNTIYSILLTIL